MATIEFFFDYSSPWTYFASERVEEFCARNEAKLVWKPFLVGGVFNKVNPTVYQRRENPVPPKDNYYRKDMADWARYLGLEIVRPSVFPVNSVKAPPACSNRPQKIGWKASRKMIAKILSRGSFGILEASNNI